jgi:hemin uptake protein HemP
MTSDQRDHHEKPRHDEGRPLEPPLVDSKHLLANGQSVRIRHNGELYVLRVTRNGKLILNK